MRNHENRTTIMGIPVNNLRMNETVDRVMKMVDQYRIDHKKRLVATANVDFIINAHNRKAKQNGGKLLNILRKADLVTADGMPLVWLSKILGRPLKERVTGADMVPALARKAAKEGKSIYLFGGNNGSAKKTAEILSEENPMLKIAGVSSPMIDMEDNLENKIEIARINITKPDVLLIALGNPKQEIWHERYKKYMKVPVSIGIGGTFEFIAGDTSRAPEWMQKHGLEWMYRMMQDPGRLIKRYMIGLFAFNLMVLPQIIMNSLTVFARRFISTPKKASPQKLGVIGMTAQPIWHHLSRIPGVWLEHNPATDTQLLKINFQDVRILTALDIFNLVNALFVARQMNMIFYTYNIGWLPGFLMRVYKVYDLIHDVEVYRPLNIAPHSAELAAA